MEIETKAKIEHEAYADKKGFFTVRVPRPMIDKFFKYLETGTVQ